MRTIKKSVLLLFFIFPVISNSQIFKENDAVIGHQWKVLGTPGFSPGWVSETCLAFSPFNEPYVFFDNDNTNGIVMKFNGTVWNTLGAPISAVWSPALAFSLSGVPYIAYSHFAIPMPGRASVKAWNYSGWVRVGPEYGFSAGSIWYTQLAFGFDSIPYVAFSDYEKGRKATVMKFNGLDWESVGIEGFSAGSANNLDLAFNPVDGLPYLAYSDFGNSRKATVMKFDGIKWVNVGNAGFSSGVAQYTTLSFSPSDHLPYVAYSDVSCSGRTTVMKFDGNNWINVGPPCFSSEPAECTCLAFSSINQMPYVAFSDSAYSFRTTVMKFDGTNWMIVGEGGFSPGKASGLSFAFSKTDIPTLSFRDFGHSQKVTVMQYDSVYEDINEIRQSELLLYPNPAFDYIVIDLDKIPNSYKSIEIYDVIGKIVFEKISFEEKSFCEISNLTPGIYIIKVKMNNNCYTRRFCKKTL